MRNDIRDRLHWMEEELMEEAEESWDEEDEEDPCEEEYEQYRQPRIRRGAKPAFHRAVYEDEEDDESRYVPLTKKKGCKGLVFLAALELLAILAVIGWWLQWLI